MLKIRLRRMGSRHRPHYRVVVSDSRRTPTAAAIEEIGYYDPRKKPSVVKIDVERVRFWQDRGAQLSETVEQLVVKAMAPPAEDVAAETATAAAAAAETAPDEDVAAETAPAEEATAETATILEAAETSTA